MDLPRWMLETQHQLAAWWSSLGPAGAYYAWLGGGIVALLAWAWFSYRLLRRLAGHRKLRGAWHSEARYLELMQLLHEDQEAGRRVLSYEEIEALRRYRYGGTVKDVIRHKGTGLIS